MSTVVDKIPEEFRILFVDVLAKQDPQLLQAFRTAADPTPEQWEETNDLFSDEIMTEFDGDVPTARGQAVKRTIEEFCLLWPAETMES